MSDAGTSFAVLGPLEVRHAGRTVTPTRPTVRRLLGILLLTPGVAVPAHRLIERVWASDSGSPSMLHINISRLRGWLDQHTDRAARVIHSDAGYRIEVAAERVDVARFRAAIQASAGEPDPTASLPMLCDALRLWRGPVLGDDIELVRQDPTVRELERDRVRTACQLADLATRAGTPEVALPFLDDLADALPYDEPLQAKLLSLLARSGRRVEALRRYERIRVRLADELGVDPSPALRQVHLDLLTESAPEHPAEAGPAGADQVPDAAGPDPDRNPTVHREICQLPPDIADFTGRSDWVAVLRTALGPGVRTALAVAAISGRGGVGKTTLAVHVAHLLRPAYPDGQFYVDLAGGQGQPVAPAAVLARFLRALGVPDERMPEGLDERVELYRSLLAFRRALVVLDNARDEAQIEPLLPGGPTCAVLVTSRRRMAGLPGAHLVDLTELPADQALALLRRIVGPDRVDAEAAAAHEIVRLCGFLPLAVRVVGARLVARPHWRLGTMAQRLAEARTRLDELSYAQHDVRVSLTLSYRDLDPDARRLFRRLGLLDVPDLTAVVGAALLDAPVQRARELLDQLADRHLVDAVAPAGGDQPRYRMHDLVRLYAREQAEAEEPEPARDAALRRVFGCWLALAEAAHRGVSGGDFTVLHGDAERWEPIEHGAPSPMTDPLAWYDAERPNLVAMVRQAAASGHHEACWDLAVTLASLFGTRCHYDEWRDTHHRALRAVRAAGDRRGEAATLTGLAYLHMYLHRPDAAAEALDRAIELFTADSDWYGLALALTLAAWADAASGRCHRSLDRYERALEMVRRAGDTGTEVLLLRSVAEVYLDLDRPGDAEPMLRRAAGLLTANHTADTNPLVLCRLGELRMAQGRIAEAEGYFRRALALAGQLRSPYAEAHARHGLGMVGVAAGDVSAAQRHLREALGVTQRLVDRHLIQARILQGLGVLEMRRGCPEEALPYLIEAVLLARSLRAGLWEARLLASLADAQDAAGDAADAAETRDRAARLRAELLDPVAVP